MVIPLAEGRIDRSHIRGEIGRVVAGELEGRRNDREVTVYKSHGVTAQDLYAAWLVYEKARQRGIGTDVAL